MYETITRHSGPAMTWSMFSINYLDIGLTAKAGGYFEKAYRNYIRPEFKVRYIILFIKISPSTGL